MKKRSILTMTVSLMLVGAVAVGSTLAYLTSTQTKTNSLTVGNVKTQLDEYGKDGSSWVDGAILVPGLNVEKKPVVTVKSGSEDCYVYMKVDMPQALSDLVFDGVVTIDGLPLDGKPGTEWICHVRQESDGITSIIYKHAMVSKSSADTSLGSLFTGITISPDATSEQMATLTDNFNITVSSFAIQANGLGSDASDDDLRLKKIGWL